MNTSSEIYTSLAEDKYDGVPLGKYFDDVPEYKHIIAYRFSDRETAYNFAEDLLDEFYPELAKEKFTVKGKDDDTKFACRINSAANLGQVVAYGTQINFGVNVAKNHFNQLQS